MAVLLGRLDKSNNLVIDFQFEDACGFADDGLAVVKSKDKEGFINKKGDFIIPAEFDIAYDFDGELAKFEIDDQFGYINRNGDIIWNQKS